MELLRALAADPDESVRHAIATRPGLPARILTRLLSDPSKRVAATAAYNADLPPAHMHRLIALAGL